jgi:hypothetical protein
MELKMTFCGKMLKTKITGLFVIKKKINVRSRVRMAAGVAQEV